MTSTRRLTLTHNEQTGCWDLKEERSRRLLKAFKSKTEATRKGVLARALGEEGGSVIIRKKGGVFEEERHFTRR
jgi:hypothetical protein